MRWTALLLAGSRPGRDAFAEAHGTDLKALIPVAGEAMVARPVKALLAARIGHVVQTIHFERLFEQGDIRPRLLRHGAVLARKDVDDDDRSKQPDDDDHDHQLDERKAGLSIVNPAYAGTRTP